MRSSLIVLATGIVCFGLLGCGKPSGGEAPVAEASNSATSGETVLPTETPPNEVVSTFLDALKSGDNTTAEQLLTGKARTETAKFDLAVRPPGTPSARYQIGQVEFVDEGKQGAHVTSVWSETAPDGEQVSYEVIWALRRQEIGWRVAGMATQVVDNQPPVFFNFEEPEEMLRKWQQADELANRQEAADGPVHQAALPDQQPATVR